MLRQPARRRRLSPPVKKALPSYPHRRKRTSRGSSGNGWFAKLFTTLALIFFLSLIIFGIFATQILNTELETSALFLRPAKIEDNTKQAAILWFDAHRKRISLIHFDEPFEVDVAGGYGTYRLAAVGPLLSLEKKNNQEQRSFFSTALGYPLDQVWTVHGTDTLIDAASLKTLAKQVLENKIDSPLSFKERWRWWFLLRSLNDQQFDREMVRSDEDWQTQREQLRRPQQQGCSVAVVNTTSVAGLARLWGALIEKMGISVVRLTDEKIDQQNTVMLSATDSEVCQTNAREIKQQLPFKVTVKEESNVRSRYRADIVLFLGKDLESFWSGKK